MKYIDIINSNETKRQMMAYVQQKLLPIDKLTKSGKYFEFRSRFGHTRRVLEWVNRINATEKGDEEILIVSAIFHDVGYCATTEEHAVYSELLFREYITSHCLYSGDPDLVEKIALAIASHSDKERSNNTLTKEQMILMDADILDEIGAMQVLWTCFLEAENEHFDYESAYNHIRKSIEENQEDFQLLHTEQGKRFAADMNEYNRNFIEGLKFELGLE